MKRLQVAAATHEPWPRLWRMVLVALGTLILCSCRGPQHAGPVPGWPPGDPPALPQQAYAGVPLGAVAATGSEVVGPPGMEAGVPLPYTAVGPWAPPGMSQPWPPNEYLADGGDAGPNVTVAPDWQVRGLQMGDTVAHFDTVDGETVVEPSNRVHIYSPRFGAVRQVVGLEQNQQRDRSVGIYSPAGLVGRENVQTAQARQQHFQVGRQIGRTLAGIYHTRQAESAMSTAIGLKGLDNGFKPYESPSAIRQGIFEASEMAWLAQGVDAAVAWSHEDAVQVILDHQAAAAEVTDQQVAAIFTVHESPANPKLRIVKVASTPFAEPGEVVDFTLRFDNVGDQVIGNVTIIDSLTTRLEYVPDSSQCSLAADFLTQPNEGDSLVLRWEISDPLEPGEGGVIRFRCRVR